MAANLITLHLAESFVYIALIRLDWQKTLDSIHTQTPTFKNLNIALRHELRLFLLLVRS